MSIAEFNNSSVSQKPTRMTTKNYLCKTSTTFLVNREIGQARSLRYLNTIRRLDVLWPPSCNHARVSQSTLFEESLWDYPVFGSAFCPLSGCENILACATEEGKVRVWKIANYKPVLLSCTDAHNNAVFDVAWHPQEKRLVTVSGDNTVVMWDVGNSDLSRVKHFLGHGQTVKSCSFSRENPDILGTGDRDGCVYIWDIRTGKVENKICPAHERKVPSTKGKTAFSRSTVTGLAFFDNSLVTVSAGSARIKVWDLRKLYRLRTQKPQPVVEFPYDIPEKMDGFSYLCLDHERQKIYLNCTNNSIYSYHLSSLGPKSSGRYVGLTNSSFYVKSCISPDGKYLLSGSSSDAAFIWETRDIGPEFQRPVRTLKTNSKEVNSVSWSSSRSNRFLIVTCGESEPFSIWSLPKGDQKEGESINLVQEKQHLVRDVRNILGDDCDTAPLSLSVSIDKNNTKHEQELNIIKTPNKRTLRVMLDNSPPEFQNKRYKTKCLSSSIKLFPSSDVTSDSRDSNNTSCDSVLCKPMSHFRDKFNLMNISNSCTDMYDVESVCVVNDNSVENVSETKQHENIPFSPTSNLPNYAVEGTSPSHVCKPRRKESIDWLTKLRCVKKPDSIVNVPVKTAMNSNLRKQNEHVRKPVQIQHGSILKFFRVLGKSNDDRCKTSQADSGGCHVNNLLEQNNS